MNDNTLGIIYKLKNKINGKIYIGQTIRSLDERIAEHSRKNTIISRAIKKYGIENFIVSVIDEGKTIDELNKKEIHWISHYSSVIPNGYNQCYGGGNTVGYHHKKEHKMIMSEKKNGMYLGEENPFFGKTHSDEQKKKWSKQRKGKDMSKVTEASLEKTRVKVINLDNGIVFDSINEAADKYNLKATHISRVCRHKRKSTGGFRWMYYDEYKNTLKASS